MTNYLYPGDDLTNWYDNFTQNGTTNYDLNSSYTPAYDDYTFITDYDNITKGNSSNVPLENMFKLPWWRQLLWSILFGGMVIVATGGNLIVVWIVLAHKQMRTVTNYFLVNLSIADAMVSTLNVTFNYIYMLNTNWIFGTLYCKISQFVANLSICASVFTLMAIAIDRYMAIMNPLRPRMGKRNTLCVAAIIWIISIIVSCPNLIYFTTFEIQYANNDNRIVCYSEWPDGATNHSRLEYIYIVILMFLTYFVPIGAMTFTYARVGIELWGSQSIGECTQRQLENIKSKRRVVKMMMVVVLIFAICWLPFHIYFIITAHYPQITSLSYIQEIYLAIYWLAMSNSMYNPIIYCWMNSRFRRGFKQFFRCCPFVSITPDTLRRTEVISRYSCSGSPDHHRIVRNDTERSFLYTCPGSPKHRMSHSGSVRLPMNLGTGATNNTAYQTVYAMNSFKENHYNSRGSTHQRWPSKRSIS